MSDLVFHGPAIRSLREAAGLTRRQLSARTLVSLSHIKAIECPGSRQPKAITLAALAQGLGCSVAAFTVPADSESAAA